MIRVAGTLPLAGRFAVRASVAYKGAWVRRIRSFARDEAARRAYAAADAWLARVASSIEPGRPLDAQLAERLKELPGASLRSWMAESCIGSYPLEAVAGCAALRAASWCSPSRFDSAASLGSGHRARVRRPLILQRREEPHAAARHQHLVLLERHAVADVVVEQVVADDADRDHARAEVVAAAAAWCR